MRLYERVRPKTWDEVVGQGKAVDLFRRIEAAGGHGGRAYWISGETGIGKTTCARIIARNHCGNDGGVLEFDAADDLGAEELDAIDAALSFRPLWGGKERRCWIINEAHGLRQSAIRRLLGILERVAADPEGRICVIFTTTSDAQEGVFGQSVDANPLLHRCTRVKLTNQGLAQAGAEYLREVARREGLDGRPPEAYVKLMRACNNSFRDALVRIEDGYMLGGEGA